MKRRPTNNPGSKAVVAYLRVSTDSQEDGYSLDEQRQTIAAYAAVNTLEITEWFEDVISGAKDERPELDRIRQMAAQGKLSTLLVYKLDRFARDTRIALNIEHELKQADAKVVSVSECLVDGPIGDMMKTILFAFATFERSQILARTKAGRRLSVRKNGTWHGGHGVYGYRPIGSKQEPGKGILRVVESEADAIRIIFDRRAENVPLASIAAELNQGGYKTMGGASFTPTHVLRVLKRETFYRSMTILNPTLDADTVAHPPILA